MKRRTHQSKRRRFRVTGHGSPWHYHKKVPYRYSWQRMGKSQKPRSG